MNQEKKFVVAIEDLVDQDDADRCLVDDHVAVSTNVTVEANITSEPA
jgi:hypothetical protein